MSKAYSVGDRIKLILDKERSPDNQWHGKTGEIIDISFDDAASVTGNPEDNFMYKIRLAEGEVPDIHFRRKDLEKVFDNG